jgi:general L-amino acid transport system permease protein
MTSSPALRETWTKRLFGTPATALTTLVITALIGAALIPIVRWAIIDATWNGTSREACTSGGACWVFVRARFGQFMYGFYPTAERWRIDLLAVLYVAVGIALTVLPTRWRLRVGLAGALLLPPLGLWLMAGGYGLVPVETRNWGGLSLTLFLSVYAALIAVPLAIVLALGRQSELPMIRTISVAFIEFWRAVPIITVIFLASILLPLILPSGVTIDRLARAIVGLGLVVAAYMAEAIRGGLQALPKGQGEAAAALGLGYWHTTAFITLPQALRISLPALTNEFIALFKNTTLVLVVSILDLLGIAQASLADPAWVGMNMEAYVFAGAIYWLICFALSRLSLALERRGPAQR